MIFRGTKKVGKWVKNVDVVGESVDQGASQMVIQINDGVEIGETSLAKKFASVANLTKNDLFSGNVRNCNGFSTEIARFGLVNSKSTLCKSW